MPWQKCVKIEKNRTDVGMNEYFAFVNVRKNAMYEG